MSTFAAGGTVRNCIIRDNYCKRFGGGVSGEGASSPGPTVRNCLIYNNTAGGWWHNGGLGYGGGIWFRTYGTADSCTVVRNEATYGVGGIDGYGGSPAIKNCIAVDNRSPSNPNISGTRTSCFSSGDPLFVNPGAGDFRLQPGSPCINAGTSNAWMEGTVDVYGDPRVSRVTNDIGAAEYPFTGALDCGLSVSDTEILNGQSVVLTATVEGNDLTGLYYRWDFENDSNVDAEGTDKQVVTNAFPGPATRYTVSLMVSNASADTATFAAADVVRVGPTNIYVTSGGTGPSPYVSWATAAGNIQDAVDVGVSGSTVWVSNGTYSLSANIVLSNAITVRSVNGPSVTAVDGNGTYTPIFIDRAPARVEGFTIRGGKATAPANDGGGVYFLWDGTVSRCIISNCTANYGGAVEMNYGGTLRNCLIVGNSSALGAIFTDKTGMTIQNCTVSGNTAGTRGGALYASSGGTFHNTILYGNSAPTDPDILKASASFTYCCSPTLTTGTGNQTGDPVFQDAGVGDYHLGAGSSCVNTGQSNSWMVAGVTDLDGNARIKEGTPEIGCYEYSPPPLDCAFSGAPLWGPQPLRVVFQAVAAGSNTNGLYYKWDFQNNGSYDAEGPDKKSVTSIYSLGVYSVKLAVSNAVGTEATSERADYIAVSRADTYVSQVGTPTFPYTNWGWAAANIQDAVNAGGPGTTVHVADGTYTVTSPVNVSNAVSVLSVNGYASTIVDGNSASLCFMLSDPDAVVDGFTVWRGRTSTSGGGVFINGGGAVRNCWITGCSAANAGGVLMKGHLGYALLRNCVVAENTAGAWGGGVGNYHGGIIENCTVVSNRASIGPSGGGGVYQNTGAGPISNSIVYFNMAEGLADSLQNIANANVRFTCTIPAKSGTGNITNDPQFVDMAGGNYRLGDASRCIDAGANASWMTNAFDIEGNVRLDNDVVDMGAVEWFLIPQGTVFLIR